MRAANPRNPSEHLLGRVFISRVENLRVVAAGKVVNVNGFPEIELCNGSMIFYSRADRLDGMEGKHLHLLQGKLYEEESEKRRIMWLKRAEKHG